MTTQRCRTIQDLGEAVRSPVDGMWRVMREMPVNASDFSILTPMEVNEYFNEYHRPPCVAWVTIDVSRKLTDACVNARDALVQSGHA